MRKTLFAAAMLAGTSLFAAASADTGMVEVKLTVDRADSAIVTYAKVQEEAARVCLKDTHCEAALVDALVAEIDDIALFQVHAEATGDFNAFQVASADQG